MGLGAGGREEEEGGAWCNGLKNFQQCITDEMVLEMVKAAAILD